MTQVLRLHPLKLMVIGLFIPLSLVLGMATGTPKAWGEIDWLDVVGEGGGALMVLGWTLMILGSRPAGRVSNLMFAGLSLIFVSLWQDNLDEFIRVPDALLWDTWMESIPMPIGMALLTLGLYRWHQEQLVLMEHLAKRERFWREHRSIDPLTHLGGADYLRPLLGMELQRTRSNRLPLSLLLVDVDGFDAINRRFGVAEGDRFLRALTDLLLMNIREVDLLCRYGGDRFAIMLPCTGEAQAGEMARQIRDAVGHFAYKTRQEGETLFATVSTGIALALDHSPEQLLERANRALDQAKQQGPGHYHAAA